MPEHKFSNGPSLITVNQAFWDPKAVETPRPDDGGSQSFVGIDLLRGDLINRTDCITECSGLSLKNPVSILLREDLPHRVRRGARRGAAVKSIQSDGAFEYGHDGR